MADFDDDGEEEDDGDGWTPEEASADTVPCPHCGRDVYEQAEICPACGKYLSQEDAPHRRAWWVIAAAVLTLAAITLHWVFGRH